MSKLSPIEPDDLPALAVGTGVLGTGGGTHPYLELLNVQKLYRAGKRVMMLDPDDLDDGDLVAEVGFMGAPLVTKERLPDPAQVCRCFEMMQEMTGRPFRAVMSSEVGGENGVLPLVVAALKDIPLLDADPRGRAFPEMQMSSFAIAGLPLYPVAMADIRGNEALLVKTASTRWSERLGRRLCTEAGAIMATCKPPRTARQIRDHAVKGSISRAIRLGRAVIDARRRHHDPVDAVLDAEHGIELFRGKVVDVARRTTDGFVRGKALVDGFDQNTGQVFSVDFQNEFTVGAIDGDIRVMVPDLICILDAVNGEAIGTETIRYGQRVAIVSLPAAPVLTTADALRVVGPRAFGYDLDYQSLHGDENGKDAA